MNTTPTPGALRAARFIYCPTQTVQDVAAVIDRETALPELVEALESCADWLCEATPHTDQWERGQSARAALAKAKGKP